MNENLSTAIKNFRAAIDSKASPEAVTTAKALAHKEAVKAKAAGDDIALAVAHIKKCEADAMISGYRTGGGSIEDVVSEEVGVPTGRKNGQNRVWGEDMQAKGPGQSPDKASSTAVRSEESGTLKDDAVAKNLEIIASHMQAQVLKEQAKKGLKKATTDAVAALDEKGKFGTLAPNVKAYVMKQVSDRVKDGDDPDEAADDEIEQVGKMLADETLRTRGFIKAGLAKGVTTGGSPVREPATITQEFLPWERHTQALLTAADDFCRRSAGSALPNPDSKEVQDLRTYNKKTQIDRLVEEFKTVYGKAGNKGNWLTMGDEYLTGDEQAFFANVQAGMKAFGDDTTTANLYNQPSIMAFLLVQSFQDMQMLPLVQSFGPGVDEGSGGFAPRAGNISSTLRIPVETYAPPAGYGYTDAAVDFYLETPEDVGIDEAIVSTYWLEFAPAWKRIAASMTRDAVRNMGMGPLNYPVIARHLFHMAWDKSRRIDRALINEMLQTSDEYGPVKETAQAYTTGNNGLPYNSVFPSSGPVIVNLNPTKLASAAVAAGDMSRTYGTGGTDAAGGMNPIGAVRLLDGVAVGTSSPAYYGDGVGPVPVLRTRVIPTLSANGQPSTNYAFQNVVSAPSSMVEGVLNAYGNIMTKPGGGATATYAIDYEYGVLLFASDVTGSAGVMTTATTITYWYSTNYDRFNLNNTGSLSNADYYDGLLQQIETSGAIMADTPRYMKPDVAIMSVQTSPYITNGSLFYKFLSPDGTALWPSEQFYFVRNGILGCRINTPWYARNHRILLSRMGSTKYAIQTPFELRGPFPIYDPTTGKLKARDGYYGEENSVIATPVVTDQTGTQLNPPNRSILLDGLTTYPY